MKRRAGIATLAVGGILGGCAVGPAYRAPQPTMPESWHQAATGGLASGQANVAEWWQVFADEQLSNLIARAAEENLELRLAMLRIREARALRGVVAGEYLPTLTGQSSYQRFKASANGRFAFGADSPSKGDQFRGTVTRGVATGALAERLGALAPGASGLTNSVATGLVGLLPAGGGNADTDELNLFATGFDAAWEIDVFGGIRRNVEAADAQVSAAVEEYRDVQISLLAEVAASYFDVRALQSQLEATRQNIELQRQTFALTQARLKADLTSELDVRQAQTNLATTESELPLLETALTITIYRLSVLLGQEPAALYDELASKRDIPQPPKQTLVGVPADILRRRPDLRAAERRLAAEVARIGVAAAELYPRFTLSGNLAFESMTLDHALDGRSVSYAFGPALRWNIFDGLRNLNRIAAQETAAHQAYIVYEQALLRALQEVESAMTAYKGEQIRRDALLRATQAARRAVQIAETRYKDGLTDFQDVLVAQRSLVNLENAVAQSQGQVAVNLVALYKALGGGWSPDWNPQAQYLEEDSAALADPLEYFFSGGKTALPWENQPAEAAKSSVAGEDPE